MASSTAFLAHAPLEAGSTLPLQEQYEIWLLDTEARNGGLSQYFGNHGLEQWRRCVGSAASQGLVTFAPFARSVDLLIEGSSDPYRMLLSGDRDNEDLWYSYQWRVVQQLRALWQSPG
jgi:hypothetical protein